MNRRTISSNVLPIVWNKYLNGSEFMGEIDRQMGQKIFNVKTSSNYEERMDGYSGFGALNEKTEEDAIFEHSLIPLRDIRAVHKTYAGGVSVSKEAEEDDRNGIYSKNCIQELGRSALATSEYACAGVLENGFDTNYTQASGPTYGWMFGGTDNGDGLNLFSASHTYANGTSWSNVASGNPTFSVTAYANARTAMMNQRNLGGVYKARNKIARIVFTPYSWLNVEQVFKSQKEPTSGNNAINPVNTEGVELVEWNLLDTYDNAWYMFSDNHYLDFFWRKKPESMRPYTKQNGDMFYAIRERFSIAWFAPQGTYASTGAGS